MSAFIVQKSHIDYIVSGWMHYGISACAYNHDIHFHTPDELGQILWDENHRSVDHLYKELNNREKYHWSPSIRKVDAVQLLKAIKCLQYQSCETSDWHKSHACYILDVLMSTAITRLPNYENLQWEVVT